MKIALEQKSSKDAIQISSIALPITKLKNKYVSLCNKLKQL